jgi:hypothetical protein
MEKPEEWKPNPYIEELLSRALLVRDRIVPVDIVDRHQGGHGQGGCATE